MDSLNEIGKRIRDQRKKIGYNVDRVAEETGINRATIYRYENGDIAKVPIDVIKKIARVIKTSPAYIMGWEEPTSKVEISPDLEDKVKLSAKLTNTADATTVEAVKILLELEDPELSIARNMIFTFKKHDVT